MKIELDELLMSFEYILKIQEIDPIYDRLVDYNNDSKNKLNKDFFIYYFTNKLPEDSYEYKKVIVIEQKYIYIKYFGFYNYYFDVRRIGTRHSLPKEIQNAEHFLIYLLSGNYNVIQFVYPSYSTEYLQYHLSKNNISKKETRFEHYLIVSKYTKIETIRYSGLKVNMYV